MSIQNILSYISLILLFITFSQSIESASSSLARVNSNQNNRVLILVDNLVIKNTHSLFIKDLKDNGFVVTVQWLNSYQNKLKEFGEYLFDHVILFCTSEAESRIIGSQQLLEFFDSGRNLIVAGDIDSSKLFRQLYNNMGVDLDQIGSQVYDDFNNADSDHKLIKSSNLPDTEAFGEKLQNPILYRGAGLTLTKFENNQVFSILRGEDTSYSFLHQNEHGSVINNGNNVILVASVQGKNNARAIFTGSLDMFSNELYEKSKSANRQFAQNLVDWSFQRLSVLRVKSIKHTRQGETEQPFEYKVKDDIRYEVEIEQYDRKQKQWVPYVANDIQVEFYMLDPYIRMALTKDPNPSSAMYYAEFKAPEQYGVFQFKVNYAKPGYSFLNLATKITVRPWRHNEYERYLLQANPYYFGIFSTIGAFFVFVLYLLYDKEQKKQQ